MSDPGEEEAMMAARLWLASMFVVVARWSTDLDVIFIISCVPCTTINEDEYNGSFLVRKKELYIFVKQLA